MATIEARQIQTYTEDQGDIFDQTYYDTSTLAATQLTYNMFNTPVSNANPYSVTNLTDPGQMSTGVQFQVQQLGIRLYVDAANPIVVPGLTMQTLFNQLGKAVLSFDIVGKGNMGEWPMQELLGVTSFNIQNGASILTTGGMNNIIPAFKKLRYPLNLASRVRFNVSLTFYGLASLDSAIAGINVKVLLRGVEQRRK